MKTKCKTHKIRICLMGDDRPNNEFSPIQIQLQSKWGLFDIGFFLSLSLCKHCFICTNYIRKLSGFFVV